MYVAGGYFLSNTEIQDLANTFIKKNLPSFTIGTIRQVEQGIMATRNPNRNFNQVIRRLALTIENYLSGTPLSETPVFIDYKPKLTLNYNTTEAVGVPIKYSLINDTDFVGDFKDFASEKKYNLLDAIHTSLEENLSLKMSKKDVALRNQEVKTAKSNYFPSLTANADATHTDPDIAAWVLDKHQNTKHQEI